MGNARQTLYVINAGRHTYKAAQPAFAVKVVTMLVCATLGAVIGTMLAYWYIVNSFN